MKYIRKIVTLTLALMLGVLPLCAPGAVAESSFNKNDWIVLEQGDVIYKDAALTKEWATVPYRMLIKLAAVRDDVGAIKSGKKVGYLSLAKAAHLTGGDTVVAKKNTYAFQKPNTSSKYVRVKKGTEFELVAVAGNCAKVVKNGVTAYVNVKHCKLAPSAD